MPTKSLDDLVSFFKSCQQELWRAFQVLDQESVLSSSSWQRPDNGGGGVMGVIRGPLIEKAGANFSEVQGKEYPAIEGEHKGKPFKAMGISTICHPFNPHAPIAHMNLRFLQVGEDAWWFGGGADLTPFIPYEKDTKAFHEALQKPCDSYESGAYQKFKAWCDEYFYIPHRQSPRGVGGVFFDYLSGDFQKIYDFVQGVGKAYIAAYPRILEERLRSDFTEEEKEGQLYWRGRYAEFNLAWDRGTRFGLMTGGNPEAIFVSLPPVVNW